MIVLRVSDVDGAWKQVRLLTDLWKREAPKPFVRVGQSWEIELPALPVDRLEYLLEVTNGDDSVETSRKPMVKEVATLARAILNDSWPGADDVKDALRSGKAKTSGRELQKTRRPRRRPQN